MLMVIIQILSKDEKLKILDSLNKAYTFENFLQKKYVGQKRFSLEGGESLIPAIDFLINIAADKGVRGCCYWNVS